MGEVRVRRVRLLQRAGRYDLDDQRPGQGEQDQLHDQVHRDPEPGLHDPATGTITADGSASGTATSSQGQALTWAEGPGAFASVLHYVAPIASAHVTTGHNATFQFTIPANVAGLAGTKVTVTVHDGGRGAAHDTYAHGVTGGAQTAYPIIGGPGVTVQK